MLFQYNLHLVKDSDYKMMFTVGLDSLQCCVVSDIRDLISVDDVMEDDVLQMGPNGGLIFCMESVLLVFTIPLIDWFYLNPCSQLRSKLKLKTCKVQVTT